jgi:1-acyl-sn-glycerol-3-phosphate acyltransferase
MNGEAAGVSSPAWSGSREEALRRRAERLASWEGRRQIAWNLAASWFLLCATSAAMLLVGALTLFRKRRLYAEGMARWLAETTLRACGVNMVVHRDRPFPESQVIYLANHTSTLDMYLLLALGLPRTRYFLFGQVRRVVPLGIIAYLMGTFFTPSQSRPEERARCFRRAERVLRRTGDSVYLSPEGQRITTGEIGHFNKGSFHLATNLHVPIVPLFIDIPPEINPGTGHFVLPGTVHVYVLPEVPTDGWRLEDLVRNKEAVRDLYVGFQDELRSRAARGGEGAP